MASDKHRAVLSGGRPWTLDRPEVPKEEAGLGSGALDGWRRQLLPHRMEGKRRMRIEARREFPCGLPSLTGQGRYTEVANEAVQLSWELAGPGRRVLGWGRLTDHWPLWEPSGWAARVG